MIKKGLSVILAFQKLSPTSPGVYRMIDQKHKVLYVGKAKNLKKRIISYTNLAQLPYRLQKMVSETAKMEIVQTSSETEALLLEIDLIKTLKPKYNILLRDGKTFPQIYINTNHNFPGIYKFRGQVYKKGKYFGPYPSVGSINNSIDILKKTFLIRSCSDNEFKNRKRPCMEYQIKRCSAPCVNYISKEEYKKSITQLTNFFKGKSDNIKEELTAKMNLASERFEYEKAAIYRDQIISLNTLINKQNISIPNLNADIIIILKGLSEVIIECFIIRNGINYGNNHYFPKNAFESSETQILTSFIKEYYNPTNIPTEIISNIAIEDSNILTQALSQIYKKKIKFTNPKLGQKYELIKLSHKTAKYNLNLKEQSFNPNIQLHKKLQSSFNLKNLPNKIEVFDNSHISGKYAIGAMIVSTIAGFSKKSYRKFNIKTANMDDDYAMLAETLERRYKRMLKEDPNNTNHSWPDLILIDGGKGQASIANQILTKLNIKIPFFCIAKGKERNKGNERFCNHKTDYFKIEDQELLHYLQRIRDQSHNFVITSHRRKRDKSILSSQLDKIPGIGPNKKKILLSNIGSVAKIRSSSIQDIARLKEIGPKLARTIKDYLL